MTPHQMLMSDLDKRGLRMPRWDRPAAGSLGGRKAQPTADRGFTRFAASRTPGIFGQGLAGTRASSRDRTGVISVQTQRRTLRSRCR
jgi:hypothetical protein